MDGSQKLPQRLLGTVRDRIGAGAAFRSSCPCDFGMDPLCKRQRRERTARIAVADPLTADIPRRSCAMRAGIPEPSPMASSISSPYSAPILVAHYRLPRGRAQQRHRAIPATARKSRWRATLVLRDR